MVSNEMLDLVRRTLEIILDNVTSPFSYGYNRVTARVSGYSGETVTFVGYVVNYSFRFPFYRKLSFSFDANVGTSPQRVGKLISQVLRVNARKEGYI